MNQQQVKAAHNRRRFLKLMGLASGSALLTGVSNRLASTVYGQTPTDGAFIVTPFNMGEIHRFSEEGEALNWTFPDFALEDIKDKCLTVEDPYHPFGEGHGAFMSLLSVSRGSDDKNRRPGGISIDRQLARDLSDGGVVRSVHLGYPYGHSGTRIGKSATDAPDQHYPALWKPQEAIAEYFGEVIPVEESKDEAAARALVLARKRASVLDFLGDDIGRMSSRLAPSERAEMDQYLTSVRQLEVDAQRVIDNEGHSELDSCSVPVWGEAEPEYGVNLIRRELMEFYYDLAGIALACGVTRVANVNGPGVGDFPGDTKYPFLNDKVEGLDTNEANFHNDVSHRVHEPQNHNYIREVFLFRGEMVRRLWSHLEAATVGDKNLADESALIWLNSMGRHSERGNHHSKLGRNPVIVVGNAGGRLKSGHVYRLPEGERCVSDVFLTVAQAMGSPIQSFGDQAHSRGAIEDMLT